MPDTPDTPAPRRWPDDCCWLLGARDEEEDGRVEQELEAKEESLEAIERE